MTDKSWPNTTLNTDNFCVLLLLDVRRAALDLELGEPGVLRGARAGRLELGDVFTHLGLVHLEQLVLAAAAHVHLDRADGPVPAGLPILELHGGVIVGPALPRAQVGRAAAVLALLL